MHFFNNLTVTLKNFSITLYSYKNGVFKQNSYLNYPNSNSVRLGIPIQDIRYAM